MRNKPQRNSVKELVKFIIANPHKTEHEISKECWHQQRKKSHNSLLSVAMEKKLITRIRVMIPSKKKMFVYRYYAVTPNFKELPCGDIRGILKAA